MDRAIQNSAIAALPGQASKFYELIQAALKGPSGGFVADRQLNHLETRPRRVLAYSVHDGVEFGCCNDLWHGLSMREALIAPYPTLYLAHIG